MAKRNLISLWNEIGRLPLSAKELEWRSALKKVMESYWETRKFQKSVVQPVVSYMQALEHVSFAADTMIRLRRIVRKQTGLDIFASAPVGGSVLEYLHDLHVSPLAEDPRGDKFVLHLVDSMARIKSGYVDGCNAELVNQVVGLALLERSALQQTECTAAENQVVIIHLHKHVGELLDKLFDVPSDECALRPHTRRLRSIRSELEQLSKNIERLLEIRAHERGTHDPSGVEQTMETETVPTSAAAAADEKAGVEEAEMQVEESESEATPTTAVPETAGEDESTAGEAAADAAVLGKIEEVASHVLTVENDLKVIDEHVRSLDEGALLNDPIQGSKNVEKLQKSVLAGSEKLVQDLLALDGIVGASETVRPHRKAQVLKIQGMLADVDRLNARLKDLISELHGRAAAVAAEEADQMMAAAADKASSPAADEAPRQAAPESSKPAQAPTPGTRDTGDAESGSSSDEDSASAQAESRRRSEITSSDNPWRALKLRPKFDVQDMGDHYMISSYIPGMSRDDIHIGFDGADSEVLSITGFRGPSDAEIAQLRAYLRSAPLPAHARRESEQAMLMRLGSGRFGSFVERFRLPAQQVDRRSVSASYNDGVLAVSIAKVRARRGRNPFFSDPEFFW